MPTIVLTTEIPAPPEACFAASLSVDAHTASMRRSGERAVAGVTSGEMGLGDTVTWRARHFGVTFRMTSRISAHDAPHRFVDEQVAGPFRRWWHEHRFEPVPGGTRMTDRVEFVAPAGPLGRLVEWWVLTRYMTRLLRTRNEWLASSLSSRA
ncbi:SRPBCC family protein [Isoptericola sp. NPDC019693]|uniref:SRPBCC family protein n=1 Tax=Isoptericola sp. NPDC019693 TaxID=3364009 RepID=UPI0037B67F40